MGKVFNLDLADVYDFEQSLNREVKNLKGDIGLTFCATMSDGTLTLKLPMTVDDVNDPNVYLNPDIESIPLEVIRILEGNQKNSLFPFLISFGNYCSYRFCIEDFITEYKKSARFNHASRFKDIDVKYSRVKGLTMTLTF